MKTEIDIRRGATSASNAQADLLCPGRHLAQKNIPEPPASEDAEFGRLIHAALAVTNEDGSKNTAALNAMTGEQRDIFDSCREIEQNTIVKYFGEDPTPKRVFREQRYWAMVDNQFEHSGQPDVIVRAGPKALIMEYKTLPGEVTESTSNEQMRDQAVLAAGHLILEEVAVAVIQPLVTMDPVITVYDQAALTQAESAMFDRVRKSNDPASPRMAGDLQCKFCRARSTCPEYQRLATSQLPVAGSIVDKTMDLWDASDCASFCAGRALAQKWLDDAEAMIKTRLKANPEEIPGWCLKPGVKREIITDPQALFSRFEAMSGSLEQFMGCITVVKGRLEERVREITKLKGRALKAGVDELTKGLVETKQNEPSIAKKKE
jgi:hypothetical protein